MSESEHKPHPDPQGGTDARPDLAEHERPETGLISDEELPEDLRPTDDNPLAKNPQDEDALEKSRPGPAAEGQTGPAGT